MSPPLTPDLVFPAVLSRTSDSPAGREGRHVGHTSLTLCLDTGSVLAGGVTASWGCEPSWAPSPFDLNLGSSRRGSSLADLPFSMPQSSGPLATRGISGVGSHLALWQSWHPHLPQPPCKPLPSFFLPNRKYSHFCLSFCGHSISSVVAEGEEGKLGSSFGWGRAPVVVFNGKYLSEMLLWAP